MILTGCVRLQPAHRPPQPRNIERVDSDVHLDDAGLRRRSVLCLDDRYRLAASAALKAADGLCGSSIDGATEERYRRPAPLVKHRERLERLRFHERHVAVRDEDMFRFRGYAYEGSGQRVAGAQRVRLLDALGFLPNRRIHVATARRRHNDDDRRIADGAHSPGCIGNQREARYGVQHLGPRRPHPRASARSQDNRCPITHLRPPMLTPAAGCAILLTKPTDMVSPPVLDLGAVYRNIDARLFYCMIVRTRDLECQEAHVPNPPPKAVISPLRRATNPVLESCSWRDGRAV